MTNEIIQQIRAIVDAHHTQYGKFLRKPENKHLLDFIEQYEQDKLKDNNFQTKVFWILNDIHDYPKCHNPNCPHGGIIKSNVRNIFTGYGSEYPACCSTCVKHTPEYLQNWGDSIERKYGKGIRHPMHSSEVKAQMRETTEERWGGIGFASPEIHQKYETKCMELFGVANGGGSEQALKKIMQTKMEKYNDPYYSTPTGQTFSKGEKEVLEYVKSIYSGTIIENDRTQMEPNSENGWKSNHELDIWLPDIKVAIEYNGTYWHSFPEKQISDHFKKLQCESKGITLITIPEQDWSDDSERCKNLICSQIGK